MRMKRSPLFVQPWELEVTKIDKSSIANSISLVVVTCVFLVLTSAILSAQELDLDRERDLDALVELEATEITPANDEKSAEAEEAEAPEEDREPAEDRFGLLGMVVMPNTQGQPMVDSVQATSTAWDAGIRKGDVILSLDSVPGQPYEEWQEAARAIVLEKGLGETIALEIKRDSEKMALRVSAHRLDEEIEKRMREGEQSPANGSRNVDIINDVDQEYADPSADRTGRSLRDGYRSNTYQSRAGGYGLYGDLDDDAEYLYALQTLDRRGVLPTNLRNELNTMERDRLEPDQIDTLSRLRSRARQGETLSREEQAQLRDLGRQAVTGSQSNQTYDGQYGSSLTADERQELGRLQGLRERGMTLDDRQQQQLAELRRSAGNVGRRNNREERFGLSQAEQGELDGFRRNIRQGRQLTPDQRQRMDQLSEQASSRFNQFRQRRMMQNQQRQLNSRQRPLGAGNNQGGQRAIGAGAQNQQNRAGGQTGGTSGGTSRGGQR